MEYDFDSSIDRTGSLKWGKWPEKIPMWIADMDFGSPPPILQALKDRVAHGDFGYEDPDPPETFKMAIANRLRAAVVGWAWRRYGWKIECRDIMFVPGVVSGLNLACRAFCKEADGVLMLTPIYPPFLRAPKNNGMINKEVPLARDDRNGFVHYTIDFDALKSAATTGRKCRMFMACHPHNPIGQVFSEGDRHRLAQFCIENDLVLCSDEIHCDLQFDGATHTPNALLSDELATRTVTLMSPSKTFNLSGLGLGVAVVTDENLRTRLRKASEDIAPPLNALSATAALTAFSGHCDEWLKQLLAYLRRNRDEMVKIVRTRLPGVKTTMPTATYLAWFDCSQALVEHNPLTFFLERAQVALTEGADFKGDGHDFLRFNFACPRRQMVNALDRMAAALACK